MGTLNEEWLAEAMAAVISADGWIALSAMDLAFVPDNIRKVAKRIADEYALVATREAV